MHRLIKPFWIHVRKNELRHSRLELRDERVYYREVLYKIGPLFLAFSAVDWNNCRNESPFVFVILRIISYLISWGGFELTRGRVRNGVRYWFAVAPYIYYIEWVILKYELVNTPYALGLIITMFTSTVLFPRKLILSAVINTTFVLPIIIWALIYLAPGSQEQFNTVLMYIGAIVMCCYSSQTAYLELNDRLKINERLAKNKSELEASLIQIKSIQNDLITKEKMALLGTMAASLSHELNNAMNFVSGAIYPLGKILKKIGDFEDKEEVEVLFNIMYAGVDLSVDIIENLKSYSKKDSGKFDKIKPFQIANTVISILKSRITDSICVNVEIPQEFSVLGSHAGFHQLVMNLFKNALDAVGSSGDINIRAIIDEEYWTLQIEDNGEGISNENIGRIFDAFFSTKVIEKGTGLGLFVVQKEVKRHQGVLAVESELGKGTVFKIRFPIKPIFNKDDLNEQA